MGARTGAVDETLNRPLAEKQAASIGATIGSDGWWYKDGRRLSHDEADALTRQAGTAAENLGAWGKNRDIWGRASDLVSKGWAATPIGQIKIGGDVGGFLERNKADIAAGVGTLISGNPLLGAAIKAGLEGAKYGATGLDAAKGALSGYGTGTLASGASNRLAGWFGGAAAAPVAATAGAGTPSTPSVPTSTVPKPPMNYLDSLKNIFSPEQLSKISLKDIGAVLGGAARGYEGYQAGQAQQAQVDIARRKQALIEADYQRQLAIAAAREQQLAPMRAQLMQMLMGQPSTLFGGSVLQGLTEPKRNA